MMPTVDTNAWQSIASAAEELQKLMAEHLQMKMEGTLADNVLESPQGQTLLVAIDRMKDLHCQAYESTRDTKQQTADAKDAMDDKQVGLQNVMYEKRHIVEEIVKCREFRSVYQHVDLISLDDFLAKAPEHYLEDKDNHHTLMINRLRFEQDERTSLKEEEERLQQERQLLIKENRKAQEKLDRFDKLLDDFVLATVPLEESLHEDDKKTTASTRTTDAMDVDEQDTTEDQESSQIVDVQMADS
ncbi:Fms-interacting protein-domain-containing protein [Halteromyces radiatus]|uniref:Fms-interacting protein-domain-containing protein n=1 Tax=Halteromyces radiatus TaxID=101107 RepID=UPI002220AF7E|nr:Fms-interacting protein-domain-containing protein [Halteromyces radiatus]KAI8085125.1 Fms-interacting protein-domain-containing protein [Halteromyces radiatus]